MKKAVTKPIKNTSSICEVKLISSSIMRPPVNRRERLLGIVQDCAQCATFNVPLTLQAAQVLEA